jgi:hypothetical protein
MPSGDSCNSCAAPPDALSGSRVRPSALAMRPAPGPRTGVRSFVQGRTGHGYRVDPMSGPAPGTGAVSTETGFPRAAREHHRPHPGLKVLETEYGTYGDLQTVSAGPCPGVSGPAIRLYYHFRGVLFQMMMQIREGLWVYWGSLSGIWVPGSTAIRWSSPGLRVRT